MTIDPVNRNFDASGFLTYVRGLGRLTWGARFVVLHATGVRIPDWRKHPDTEWDPNLWVTYRKNGWAGGPHIFATERGINVANPLTRRGTHSPSWNDSSFGLEQEGLFQPGGDPYLPAIRANAVAAAAVLYKWMRTDPSTLRFHYEDPNTSHKVCPCPPPAPGRAAIIDKPAFIESVRAQMMLLPSL